MVAQHPECVRETREYRGRLRSCVAVSYIFSGALRGGDAALEEAKKKRPTHAAGEQQARVGQSAAAFLVRKEASSPHSGRPLGRGVDAPAWADKLL